MAWVRPRYAALDYPSGTSALSLVDRLGERCRFYRTGSELFTSAGPEIVTRLRDRGADVFVSGVVLLAGTAVVLTTMMASVAERTQEIGMLRAVGYRRTQVARVILFEALVVNLSGDVAGWLAGFAGARAPRRLCCRSE